MFARIIYAFNLLALTQVQGQKLEGIGYREQELQQASSAQFSQLGAKGIPYVSFAGNTHIYVESFDLDSNAQSNTIMLFSKDLNVKIAAPPLTADDAFNSNPAIGHIAYRLPSVPALFNMPDEKFDTFQVMTFVLSVLLPDNDGVQTELKCSVEAYCTIKYQRDYTPVLFELNPPVVYKGSLTQIWFNPKQTPTVITLSPDDETMPFINLKIGGVALSFPDVDNSTVFETWNMDYIVGRVNDVPNSNSSSLQMLWETGNAYVHPSQKTCYFNQSHCYNVRTVPVINSISQKQGYTTGGQNLVIKGYGFGNDTLDVKVDNQPCSVTNVTNIEINCKTSAVSSVSSTGNYAGQHGVKRTVIQGVLTWADLRTKSGAEDLLMQFEQRYNDSQQFSSRLQSWFIAPESTRYRFWMSCYPNCKLYFDSTPDSVSGAQEILNGGGNWYETLTSTTQGSAWFTLEKGKKYYLEGAFRNGNSVEHYTVGVEIEQTAIAAPILPFREMQRLSANTTLTFEKTRVNVTNATGGLYKIAFSNPKYSSQGLYNYSLDISDKATAAQFQSSVRPYYVNEFGSEIDVTVEWYDNQGVLTTDPTQIWTYSYIITLRRLIKGTSVDGLMAVKSTTKSDIAFDLPVDLQVSKPPLNGYYKIRCKRADGTVSETDEINYNTWGSWIGEMIGRKCFGMRDRIIVRVSLPNTYFENGFQLYIDFRGYSEDPNQYEIVPATVKPALQGDTSVQLDVKTENILSYSQNIFYRAIPFEMLKTFETVSQVIVNVGKHPAVCDSMSCSYQYVSAPSQITSFAPDPSKKTLGLSGTNLPNGTTILSIVYAGSNCILSTATFTATSIQCKMDKTPTCGATWKPEIVTSMGIVPVSAAAQNVGCNIQSVQNNTNLNVLGGNQVTITGTNFPSTTTNNSIEIKTSDGTQCNVTSTNSTQMNCTTSAFQSGSLGQNLSLTAVINGQTATQTMPEGFAVNPENIYVQDINPKSVSPVLRLFINITLEQKFTQTVTNSDFDVQIWLSSSPEYKKRLPVVASYPTAKTITVKYIGAISGDYNITVKHSQWGLLDTSKLLLKVESEVSSISPLVGSIYGGTLVTLNGKNWGNETTDNPVEIYFGSFNESKQCYVVSTNDTQIKCRLDTRKQDPSDKGKMIVFLKTYEEANCTLANKCEFSFTSTVPDVTAVSSQWDATNNKWTIKATGTGFTGTPAQTELVNAGKTQKCESVTATEAVFSIIDSPSENLQGMSIFWDVGLGTGDAIVSAPIILEPKLVSVSPNQVSAGGGVLTLNVQGVGPATQGLSIVDSAGNGVCVNGTTKIEKYGVVKCLSLAKDINSGLKVKLGSQTYSCANTDQTKCSLVQNSASVLTPTVNSANVMGDNKIVFIGTNFPLYQNAKVTFNGVETADTVITSTTVTATFKFGVPSASGVSPIIAFEDQQTKVVNLALMKTTLDQNLTLGAPSNTNLLCSFAGGCSFSFASTGLSSRLDSNLTNLTVCGEPCQFEGQKSSPNMTTCRLPPMPTAFSNPAFQILTEDEDLKSGQYFGSGANYLRAFDNNNGVGTDDNNANCNVGMKFNPGFVGILSQVKFFLYNVQLATFNGNLIFQGSFDEINWTNIFTVDGNVHEGWNYQKFDDPASKPKFRVYRFIGKTAGSCNIKEIKFAGTKAYDNTNNLLKCNVELQEGAQPQKIGTITYSELHTPVLQAISPRYGPVTGGTSVTFSGQMFSNNIQDYSIVIDGFNCQATAANDTSVTCLTAKRPGLHKSSLVIDVKGKGSVSLGGRLFNYVSVWSDPTTWGGDFAPQDGESIWIPSGMNLYVDIDKSPLLKAVLVEGSLIFEPKADKNHQRFFDAHYIFMNKGKMEVGTEQFPYTSKITITMHGDEFSPYIPIYGNKVIGVRRGVLDIHGEDRATAWTQMEKTAEAGDSQITLCQSVDWREGELIAIASSSFNGREYEKRTITKVDNSNPQKPVVTLDSPLQYRHYAAIEMFGNTAIDMRAEVGLLSRSIVVRGDPETTSINRYGAIIFVHSHGDDSVIARLSNFECFQCGQSFKVGRYAVHFHMIGAVHKSYARQVAVHESFNRAFTIHGTFYLRLVNNVVVHAQGHNFFIEDAVEQFNIIRNNLAMGTEASFSLLNTDQTPASFWITHPNNEFRNNHAAGSDRYGYWYDLQNTAIGPSTDVGGCPNFHRVGIFMNNTAHSNGRYGLRIFHIMIPRETQCLPVIYDWNNSTDPFWKNPIQTMIFEDLTSYKNGRNGAIALNVGDVRFNNFKCVDNILAGMEMELTNNVMDNRPGVYNSVVVGASAGNADKSFSPHGIIGPRTEYFTIRNVSFYNFDYNEASALGDCSHCFHPASTDSGARTYTTSQLNFINTPRRIRYQFPYKGIFHDLDGSLTNLGPNTYASKYYKHLEQPECIVDMTKYDGVVCNSSVTIRRIAFYGGDALLSGMAMYLLKWDDEVQQAQPNLTLYKLDQSQYGKIDYTQKLDPGDSWAIPVVTGHKYKIHWASVGLDWINMNVEMSDRWETTDKAVYLVHNFSDVRVAINVTYNNKQIMNDTLYKPAIMQSGFSTNLVLNDTATREFHLMLNGQTSTLFKRRNIKIKGQRCWEPCVPLVGPAVIETKFRYWSDPNSWTSGQVPVADDIVEIEPTWNMVYDVAESPIIKMITVNGRLSFLNDTNLHLHVKHLFIHAGEVVIGYKNYPFKNKAIITLHGERNSASIVYTNAVEAGNKNIANVGKIRFYGQKRSTFSRLYSEALAGSQTFSVAPGLDWQTGDRIALAPTSFDNTAADDVQIQSYNSTSGEVTVDKQLRFYHWGKANSTASTYGTDLRGEVMLLTRNIVVRGEDIESWGCNILTGDLIGADLSIRGGSTVMDGVEIYNCSQYNTWNSALRWENSRIGWSEISNSAIHNGFAWGVNLNGANNIRFFNNVIFGHMQFGVNVIQANNITFDNNIVSRITERLGFFAGGHTIDKWAGIAVCSFVNDKQCKGLSFKNNIVAGAHYLGMSAYGHQCGLEDPQKFRNNTVHSVLNDVGGHGAIVVADPTDPTTFGDHGCYEASYWTTYKCSSSGLTGGLDRQLKTEVVRFTNNLGIDSVGGIIPAIKVPQWTGRSLNPRAESVNNMLVGDSEIPDCPQNGNGGYCFDLPRGAVSAVMISDHGNDIHPTMKSGMPYHKTHGYGAREGYFLWKDNTFKNFAPSTRMGQKQVMINLDKEITDHIQISYFINNKFENVSVDGLAYVKHPNPAWANIDDCGNFPCTGPLNILWYFRGTLWSQSQQSSSVQLGKDFQIIANNSGLAPAIPNCKPVSSWNGYACDNPNLAIFVFESLDDDNEDRSMQPIYIKKQGTSMNNKLNAFMDHCWDGFYTCQKRLQRFVAAVDATPNSVYEIVYTGSPAKSQRFTLENNMQTPLGMTVRIHFPDANSRSLVKNGTLIPYNSWVELAKEYGPVKGSFCGENRFVGVKNYMEFYLTNERSCVIEVSTRDAILVSVRMQWTEAQFFADGGTTKFVDRLAASLGIHTSEIKIVSVYTGSLIVDYSIQKPYDVVQDTQWLEDVRKKNVDMYSTNKMNLGAPILDTTVKSEQVITNGVVTAQGYKPIVIYNTTTNSQPSTTTSTQSTSSSITTTTTSTPSTSSSSTSGSNVITNTKQEFTTGNQQTSSSTNAFNGLPVVTEEQSSSVDTKKVDQLQAQVSAQQAEFQKTASDLEESQKLMKIILVLVVCVLVFGLIIYCVVRHFYKKNAQELEVKTKIDPEIEFKEIEQTDQKTNAINIIEGMQYDVTKDFNSVLKFQHSEFVKLQTHESQLSIKKSKVNPQASEDVSENEERKEEVQHL